MAGAALAAATASAQETAEIHKPWRPNTAGFSFASTFQGEDALRTGEWVLSKNEKYDGQEAHVRVEDCDIKERSWDRGLLLAEGHKHYAVGAPLGKPFENKGKDLVVQYEVQMRNGANCGGAYIKLLRGEAGSDMAALKNDSPYTIMFGPDKCFKSTNKVHSIFQYENPKSSEWEEKHSTKAPKIKDDSGYHVYTLHVKAEDNTFDIYIDTELASSGNLLEDLDPSIIPPVEIDDPDDKQPDDWVTKKKIPDPEAAKPDDWDDDAPRRIPDEDAKMPDGWLENTPEYIPDPNSSKPADWDDEEDGEWEPVTISNPECESAPGCGKWTRPTKPNPDFKGKWKAPMIENPDYKGPWYPRKIENPDYFEVENPSDLAPITGVAVEIWTVDGGVWLDNFVLGHDVSAALQLAEETWRPKFDTYQVQAAAEKKKREAESKSSIVPSSSSLLSASRAVRDMAKPYLPAGAMPIVDKAADNPLAILGTLLAGLVALIVMLSSRKRKTSQPPAQEVSTTPSVGDDTQADGTQENAQDDVDSTAANDTNPAPAES